MVLNKKVIKTLLVILITPLLTGCFNYKDINKVTFATSMIFDVDEFDNVQLYIESIKPYRSTNDSSDKGKRIIYKGEGKTVLEAIRDINMASSNNINFSQNRAYIFTEKSAKLGLNNYLNLVNNNQEFQIKPSLYIYYGNIQELLEISSNDEEYLGTYLSEMTQRNKFNPRVMESNINTYLNNILIGSNTNVIGSIEVRKDALDKKIELSGGAVIKENKLIERLDKEQGLSYNLLMGEIERGTLEVANPQDKTSYVTLEILESNSKCKLEKKDGGFILHRTVNIKTTLGEAQNKLIIDGKTLNEIKSNKEEDIKKYIVDLFETYKKNGIDIFKVKREMEIKFPHEDIENPIEVTDFNLDVNISIDGTGVIKNTI